MRLPINTFKGMIPVIESSKLPDENATTAVNCRFDSGSLEAYFSTAAESANLAVNTQRIYLYADQHWFSWSDPVSAAPSPVNNDTFDRVYFTGLDYPRMTANSVATGGGVMPNLSYRMGVKQPDAPIVAGYVGNEQNEAGQEDDITRFYLQTYVNAYGEESMPSYLSEEVTLTNPSAQVNLTLSSVGVNQQNITNRRIYRSVADSYQLVAELSIGATSFTDNLGDDQLGITLDSYNYVEPLEDMQGLTLMANGILSGFSGNTLCFSESFLPHAWPPEYQLTTEFDIVGIAAIGDSVVVGTTGNPYLFSGVSPDAISARKIELAQSCVSADSMVDMGNFAMYASPDGLVAVGPGSAEVVTKQLFNKEQWKAYQPDTIRAAYYEEKYVAFYGTQKGFVFDPRTLDFVELDFNATALFSDLKRDKLYMVVGGSLVSFDNHAGKLPFTWTKAIRLDNRPGPSAIYIDTSDPANTGFSYAIDGVEMLNYADLSLVEDRNEVLIHLPAQRGKTFEIGLTGTARIDRVALGSSLYEAKNG